MYPLVSLLPYPLGACGACAHSVLGAVQGAGLTAKEEQALELVLYRILSETVLTSSCRKSLEQSLNDRVPHTV